MMSAKLNSPSNSVTIEIANESAFPDWRAEKVLESLRGDLEKHIAEAGDGVYREARLRLSVLEGIQEPGKVLLKVQLAGLVNGVELRRSWETSRKISEDVEPKWEMLRSLLNLKEWRPTPQEMIDIICRQLSAGLRLAIDEMVGRRKSWTAYYLQALGLAQWGFALVAFVALMATSHQKDYVTRAGIAVFGAIFVAIIISCFGSLTLPPRFYRDDPVGQLALNRREHSGVAGLRMRQLGWGTLASGLLAILVWMNLS